MSSYGKLETGDSVMKKTTHHPSLSRAYNLVGEMGN